MRARRMRRTAPALLAVLLGAAACGGGGPEGAWPEVPPRVPSPVERGARPGAPAPQSPARVPESAAPEASLGPLALEGRWLGAPCGLRNYERLMELAPGGAVRLEERVSPCPPGAVCVWSGIEVVGGRWQRRDEAVLLRLDDPARPLVVEPPSRLVPQSVAGGLALEDDLGCRYTRIPDEVPEPPAPATPAPAPGP